MLSAPADAIEVAAGIESYEFAFSQPSVPPQPRIRSFLLSAAGHCAFFFLLPYLANIHFFADEPPVKLYISRIQSLNLKITEPLYAPPPPPRARHSPGEEGARNQESTGTKVLKAPILEPESGGSTPSPEPPKPAVVAKKFEMPAQKRQASPTQPVVLQPPDPSIGVPVQQLPRVIAWNDPVLPRPKPKPFVTPGRREKTPDKPAELTAPPTLDVSARSGLPSTVNIGPAPSLPRPRLTMPQSRTAPLRLSDGPPAAPELTGGEIATGVGDPANLIIFSPNGGKPNELVAVPPGSNVPRAVAEGGGAGAGAGRNGVGASRGSGTGSGVGAGSGSGNGTGTGAGSGGTSAKAGSGSGNGNGSGSGTGTNGAGTGGPGAGTNGSGSGAVSGSGPSGSSGKTPAVIALSAPPPAAASAAAAPMRRGQVRPGVFDVVVVQSTVAETQFRSIGILKGKPIYTVYLQLGLPKAWILQYCLPAGGAAASAVSGVVRLDDPESLAPPFPVATLLSEVELQPKTSYTLIHGFLTAAGKFRNMTLLGKVDPQLSRLLQLLDKWEFQPARKGDAPAEVEVLLAIPPG